MKGFNLKFTLVFTLIFVLTMVSMVNAQEKPEFYMVTHGLPTNTYWGAVYNGWMDACEIFGVKGTYVGAVNIDDPLESIGNLEAVTAKKPDGIAVCIDDPFMFDKSVRFAIGQGIPVVATNIRDPRSDDERIPYLVYIGENSYQMGVVEAKGVLNKFVEIYGRVPKRVIFLNHAPGILCLTERAAGAKDVCDKMGVANYDVVPTKGDPAEIHETVRAYVQKYPDTEAVLTGWSQVAVWSTQALRELGKLGNRNEPAKEGNVYVGGIDVDAECLQLILDGDIILTVDQQPYLQGFLAVVVLYNWDKYKLSPFGAINTGPLVIDPSNAEEMIELAKKGIRG